MSARRAEFSPKQFLISAGHSLLLVSWFHFLVHNFWIGFSDWQGSQSKDKFYFRYWKILKWIPAIYARIKNQWMWWSNRPHSNSKKQLHWKCPVEKGNSGKFCQNARICSTPSQMRPYKSRQSTCDSHCRLFEKSTVTVYISVATVDTLSTYSM